MKLGIILLLISAFVLLVTCIIAYIDLKIDREKHNKLFKEPE